MQKNRIHHYLRLPSAVLLCLAGGLSMGGGCGVGDGLNNIASVGADAVNSIDVAIHSLNVNSAQWQQIMRDLETQLPAAENDIKNDVDEVLQRALGGATTDLIATSDFFARRMTEGLERLKAKILGVPYIEPPPAFISFAPDKVEMARVGTELNSITVFGYDFDRKDPAGQPMKLRLFDNGQFIDVTHALALPTHYRAVFNLGSNGVPLTHTSDELQLTWNGQVISTLSVVQPPPPQPRDITVGLASMFYVPPHTAGDSEFDGNGPAVTLRAVIAGGSANTLIAKVYMKAMETEDDWTTAEGWSEWQTVYTADPGVRILAILSPLSSEASYVDHDHNQDPVCLSPADLVSCFYCVGDTSSGNDAGHATSVNVQFNAIRIRVIGP